MTAEKRVIKKYPNRRLYDTATSCYITLADVKQLVLEQVDVQVLDAKSGEDITRSVLLQIILEEEAGGMPMFSYEVLTQIIRFYGHAMQGLMGNYLEKNLQLFTEMQGRLQDQAKTALNGEQPLMNPNIWGDFMKFQGPALQNMMSNYLESSTTLFVDMQQQLQERARHLFTGFGMPGYGKKETASAATGEPEPSSPPPEQPEEAEAASPNSASASKGKRAAH